MFELVPAAEWRLSQRIDGDRRKRLLETPYCEVIRLVVAHACIRACEHEPMCKVKGLSRASILIEMDPAIVGLFHNGAGGYRAQFYVDPNTGEQANRYALSALLPRLRTLLEAMPDAACPWRVAGASLSHAFAKVWINEGSWLSDGGAETHNLEPDRWQQNATEHPWPHKRFEAWHAYLTPHDEHYLDVKGAWLDGAGTQSVKAKLGRSKCLHDHGFT